MAGKIQRTCGRHDVYALSLCSLQQIKRPNHRHVSVRHVSSCSSWGQGRETVTERDSESETETKNDERERKRESDRERK